MEIFTNDGPVYPVAPGTRMADPPHPGEMLFDLFIKPLRLTITEAAQALGVSRGSLSELVNKRRGVSPEMAIRLEKVFGFTRDMWLGFSEDYDLAHVDENDIIVNRIYRTEETVQ